MAIKLTKEEIFDLALDSFREKDLTSYHIEIGFFQSQLTIGGIDYMISFTRDMKTKKWFVSQIANLDGTPVN